VTSGDFVATTLVDTSLLKTAAAGVSVYEDPRKTVGITVSTSEKDRTVSVYKRDDGKDEIISSKNIGKGSQIYLRMTVINGYEFHFAFSEDGQKWTSFSEISFCNLGEARIALTVGGERGGAAKFDWLRVTQ